MRKFLAAIILLLLPLSAWGAALTSKVVGTLGTPALASLNTNWVGDVAPVDGDTVTVANGAVVIQDVNRTYGSKAGAVGHAVTINGASSASYGTFIPGAGITLTLRGFDATNNTLMKNNHWGVFAPQPGAIIAGDVAGDYTSIIDNRGIIQALGTAQNPITWTVPAVTWNTNVASDVISGAGMYTNPVFNANINTFRLTNFWIANENHDGLGSYGHSSLSFSAKNPGTILTTEVATLAAVDALGKYWVDYKKGIVFFYGTGTANTCTATYYKLVFNGWGIVSTQNTTYNSAVFDHNVFNYMGNLTGTPATGSGEAVVVKDKNVTDPTQTFSFTNNTVDYCARFMSLQNITGTAGNLIPITGNTIYSVFPGSSSVRGTFINASNGGNSYVRVGANTFDMATTPTPATGTSAAVYSGAVSANSNTYWLVDHNTGTVDVLMYGGYQTTDWLGLQISDNILDSLGTVGTNAINTVGSSDPAHPVVIQDNRLRYFFRSANLATNTMVRRNIFTGSPHHGLYFAYTGSASNKMKFSNISILNNLFTGRYNDAGFFHFGYTNYTWLDNIIIAHNTFSPTGVTTSISEFNWIDPLDSGIGVLATNVKVYDNIVANSPGYAFARQADTSTTRGRFHVLQYDYSDLFSNSSGSYSAMKGGTFLAGGVNYNTGTRNISGIALTNPSYTLPEANARSLVWNATSKTLKWGNGDAVALTMPSQGSGTITSFVTNTYNTTINDTNRTWSTSLNNSANPTAYWLYHPASNKTYAIVKTESATQLTVAPVMSPPPTNADAYVIYQSEVTLYDTAGSTGGSISAGVVYGDLPGTDQTDTGITIVGHDITANANFVDSSVQSFTGFTPKNTALSGAASSDGTYIGAVPVYIAAPVGGAQTHYGFGFDFE